MKLDDPIRMTAPTLKRALSLPMMVLYGLGTTIGAGIYALIGKVAGTAGYYAPISFLVASLLAGFTALSFAEMAGRHPRAAGAALYVQQGLGRPRLGAVVGLLVIMSGLVSAAALINAFIGYLHTFIAIEHVTAAMIIALLIGLIAAWGIAESVSAAAVITLIEVGGLLLVIAVSGGSLVNLQEKWPSLLPPLEIPAWSGIFAGVALAFYAFIGFEDMVDVAEEIRDVRRNLPLAIILTLAITTLLYFTLMLTALAAMTPAELAASEAPLADLYALHSGGDTALLGIIGMFAIINGALIQVIMASRVFYGLASRRQLPAIFARVHGRTRTPLYATAAATLIVLLLALIGTLEELARGTSLLMLTVFALVNLSLWRIKRQQPAPAGSITVPRFVPAAGFLCSSLFVVLELSGIFT